MVQDNVSSSLMKQNLNYKIITDDYGLQALKYSNVFIYQYTVKTSLIWKIQQFYRRIKINIFIKLVYFIGDIGVSYLQMGGIGS